MTPTPEEVYRQKRQIRVAAYANRRQQVGQEELSRQICRRLAALPEYRAARTVMCYVDFGAEVRTRPFFPAAWADSKRIAVPYCLADRLGLFLLSGLEELAAGTLGILEPGAEFRSLPDRRVEAAQLDLIVVPGVAFDRRGGRLGRGKGFYDRFLAEVGVRPARVGLAFECQMLAEVPMLDHDAYVDKVITEKAVYQREPPR